MIVRSNPLPRLVELIHAEYREMPGMSLTKPQFQRLWGLDAVTRDALLETLIAAQVLRCTARNAYVLADTAL